MNKKQINDLWDMLYDIQVKIEERNKLSLKTRCNDKAKYMDLLYFNGEIIADITKAMDILGAEIEDL